MKTYLSNKIIGNGQTLLHFSTMTQPDYWLIRIDSETDINSEEFIDEIVDLLEDEFGVVENEDDECPLIDTSCGYHWGVGNVVPVVPVVPAVPAKWGFGIFAQGTKKE